jgi:hypothetical protein
VPIEPSEIAPTALAGSLPLRRPRHEHFARLRAELMPAPKAYIEAFRWRKSLIRAERKNAIEKAASRLESRPDVAARIAWFCRQEESIIAAKRERLEARLWAIHEHNPAVLFEMVEKPLRENGKIVRDADGNVVMTRKQVPKPLDKLSPELLAVIDSVSIDPKGATIKTVSRMAANQALRQLLGISPVAGATGEIADMNTADIVQELQSLGVNVQIGVAVTVKK